MPKFPFRSMETPDSEIERKALAIIYNAYEANIPVPVDVELIAELFVVGSLAPIPDLVAKFDVAAVLWHMSPSEVVVCVDQEDMDLSPARSRFSVAHEIGHAVLHKDIYRDEVREYTMTEAIRIQGKIGCQYRLVEDQANHFARALLIPRPGVERVVAEKYSILTKRECNPVRIIHQIAAQFGRDYEVSQYVAYDRLRDLQLEHKIETAAANRWPTLYGPNGQMS